MNTNLLEAIFLVIFILNRCDALVIYNKRNVEASPAKPEVNTNNVHRSDVRYDRMGDESASYQGRNAEMQNGYVSMPIVVRQVAVMPQHQAYVYQAIPMSQPVQIQHVLPVAVDQRSQNLFQPNPAYGAQLQNSQMVVQPIYLSVDGINQLLKSHGISAVVIPNPTSNANTVPIGEKADYGEVQNYNTISFPNQNQYQNNNYDYNIPYPQYEVPNSFENDHITPVEQTFSTDYYSNFGQVPEVNQFGLSAPASASNPFIKKNQAGNSNGFGLGRIVSNIAGYFGNFNNQKKPQKGNSFHDYTQRRVVENNTAPYMGNDKTMRGEKQMMKMRA